MVLEGDHFRVYDINSEDTSNNIYNRAQLCNDIRSRIEDILGIKRYREIRDGYFWNPWRKWIVLFRTNESYQFERYLELIAENCEQYSTPKLVEILKELNRFWKNF